jgi:hypothetical protein
MAASFKAPNQFFQPIFPIWQVICIFGIIFVVNEATGIALPSQALFIYYSYFIHVRLVSVTFQIFNEKIIDSIKLACFFPAIACCF